MHSYLLSDMLIIVGTLLSIVDNEKKLQLQRTFIDLIALVEKNRAFITPESPLFLSVHHTTDTFKWEEEPCLNTEYRGTCL